MEVNEDSIERILEYLEFEGNPRLIRGLEGATLDDANIPARWQELMASEMHCSNIFRDLWAPLQSHLPKTFEVVERKLQDIAGLVTDSRPPSLLYFFSKEEDLFTHRGYTPAHKFPELCSRLPVALSEFYKVHNGWVDLYSGDTGLLPLEEWEIIGREAGVSEGFLQVFSHGGSALGFDLDDTPPTSLILWSDGKVEPISNVWSEIDQWMYNIFEDQDDNIKK